MKEGVGERVSVSGSPREAQRVRMERRLRVGRSSGDIAVVVAAAREEVVLGEEAGEGEEVNGGDCCGEEKEEAEEAAVGVVGERRGEGVWRLGVRDKEEVRFAGVKERERDKRLRCVRA